MSQLIVNIEKLPTMINIKKLKQLREETDVSYTLCKEALEKSNNNLEKAKKILFEKGAEKMNKRLNKKTTEGAIFSYIHHNKKIASLIELQCQTDFVSKNKEFQKLGNELAMQIASSNPKTINELKKQPYIREGDKSINNIIKESMLKLGENIKIKRFVRWEL